MDSLTHFLTHGAPVQTIWILGLEELLHDFSPRNEEKQYGRQIHPFSFENSPLLITNVEHLFQQTNR